MRSITALVLGMVVAVQACKMSFQNEPVCGNDGRTYINEVALNCAAEQRNDLEKVSDGKCAECKCLQVWAPVCGSDGVSYFSACQLACQNDADVQVKSGGFCPCKCEPSYKPVCGSDGKTYGNKCVFACYANAFQITLAGEGECQ